MLAAITLSSDARIVAGILLITVVTVEAGGLYLLQAAGGRIPLTDIQRAFHRAGHAHAGILVTLALVCQVLADAADLPGWGELLARLGVPAAAILMPAGFFLSTLGRDVTRPNRLIVLIYLGGAAIAVGVVTLGIGLLRA